MDITTNGFERRWSAIFLAMYLLIILPFPVFFSTDYIAGWLGVPVFIYGWLIHASLVFGLIALFAWQCLQRPEYQDLPGEEA
ncbi:hypothetical protein [Shimwellia blattae]|uniref:DUF3311 domain-containing protein n=1 Tax=Shimwellia blattae (strain ATCC 29907 / DSM 4481 / JCM 1650 / NBRC 105725 / CDC 9005-74) TaxID=630626 RepID=I2B5U5_SHIBC|nr:hypothetical protein [Shimwellia blattae]AFJ45899.1 hypothetical protein EBL_c07760 [Shimwellia blattae DSM 4481 = NBRC 105725]GAB81659.1 hypothetical protein EB105725_15_00600 [Shimwellia blattae DSM 4481 = NBRC 105725]VDY63377.1 Uncharacterised protein [Shimwellia blattae]VEC21212.1 Uncharacterised protein [Shimwellia blattae]